MLILSFKFLTETCGGTYIGQRGVIHSPGFPGSNYPDSSSCEWYLEGPTGHYLTLSYVNFSLQASPECSVDYVEIREYNASGKARIAQKTLKTVKRHPYCHHVILILT